MKKTQKNTAKQKLKQILVGKSQTISQHPNLTSLESNELDELMEMPVGELNVNQLDRLRCLIVKSEGLSMLENLTEEESVEYYQLGIKPEHTPEEFHRYQLLDSISDLGREALKVPLTVSEYLEYGEMERLLLTIGEEEEGNDELREKYELLNGRWLMNPVETWSRSEYLQAYHEMTQRR